MGRKIERLSLTDWLIVVEAFFGGLFVTISRGLVIVFFTSIGLTLREIFLINGFAGLIVAIQLSLLYHYVKPGYVKNRLLLSMITERIMWYLIPYTAYNRQNLYINYISAMMASYLTSIYLNILLYSSYTGKTYDRILGYRNAFGATAGILGQIISIIILTAYPSRSVYVLLYTIAFFSGLTSTLIIYVSPVKGVVSRVSKMDVEAEIKASTTYILALLSLVAINLVSISWIPLLKTRFKLGDNYLVALTLTQSLSTITSSLWWSRLKRINTYRFSFILLSFIALMITSTRYYPLHYVLAVLYSYAITGVSMFIGISYSRISEKIGTLKASTLISSSYALSLAISGFIGAFINEYNYILLLSSFISIIALTYSLTTIHELAVIKKEYVRVYARTIYNISLTSYNFTILVARKTLDITIKLLASIILIILFYIIYRMLYYIYMHTPHGG